MSALRRLLSSLKRLVLNRRPRGLRGLGAGSAVRMPRTIAGRKYVQIGKDTTLMLGARIEAIDSYSGQTHLPSVAIGNNVYIGRHFFLTAIQSVEIGDGCVFSDYVYLADSSHGYDPQQGPIMLQPLVSKGPIRVGRNCFLGYRTVIMPGVTLGEWCIVGANSVVTRSFPPYSMIAGSPARLIKRYSHETGQWLPA